MLSFSCPVCFNQTSFRGGRCLRFAVAAALVTCRRSSVLVVHHGVQAAGMTALPGPLLARHLPLADFFLFFSLYLFSYRRAVALGADTQTLRAHMGGTGSTCTTPPGDSISKFSFLYCFIVFILTVPIFRSFSFLCGLFILAFSGSRVSTNFSGKCWLAGRRWNVVVLSFFRGVIV